ncbi:MAG: hypothetical protein WB493_00975 [Anaeromyxobacteraceae bacterium]
MKGGAPRTAIQRVGDQASRGRGPRREIQELWFALAHRPWSLLTVIPVGAGASAAAVAISLADVGRRLREAPVTFLVMAETIDYPTASRIVRTLGSAGRKEDAEPGSGPASRLVIAIPSVLSEPLGLVVAKAADAVVLCIEKGRTTMPEARRTIELIGKDRVAGCLYVE